jgi:hypothetical protein
MVVRVGPLKATPTPPPEFRGYFPTYFPSPIQTKVMAAQAFVKRSNRTSSFSP